MYLWGCRSPLKKTRNFAKNIKMPQNQALRVLRPAEHKSSNWKYIGGSTCRFLGNFENLGIWGFRDVRKTDIEKKNDVLLRFHRSIFWKLQIYPLVFKTGVSWFLDFRNTDIVIKNNTIYSSGSTRRFLQNANSPMTFKMSISWSGLKKSTCRPSSVHPNIFSC